MKLNRKYIVQTMGLHVQFLCGAWLVWYCHELILGSAMELACVWIFWSNRDMILTK